MRDEATRDAAPSPAQPAPGEPIPASPSAPSADSDSGVLAQRVEQEGVFTQRVEQEGVFAQRVEQELGIAGGLTADDVARRALATSDVLDARRADIRAASAEVDRAFAAYLPKLDLLARYTRLSYIDAGSVAIVTAPDLAEGPINPATDLLYSVPLSFKQPLNQYTFQASLTVPISDYFLRIARVHDGRRLAESAARRSLTASELQTAADARTLFYGWVRARLSWIVATQALADAQAHFADVRSAHGAGKASRANVLAVDARVADTERLVEVGENLIMQLEEQLRILLRDPPTTTYRVGETLAEPPAGAASERLPELTQTALTQRPEIEALELRAKAVQAGAAAERAGAYPRLDLFGNAHYDNPNIRIFPPREKFVATWDAGVQLSWTVSDIPGASAAGRSQSASAASVISERRALMDQIRSEVTVAYTALLDARATIRASVKSLADADEAHRARRAMFQNGRATNLEVMDAELELTRARLMAVMARIDLKVAHVRLDYALGRNPANAVRKVKKG